MSLEKLSDLFEGANYIYLLIPAALLIINLNVQFLKWKYISSQLMGVNEPSIIISSMFQGFTAGLFTPLRAGEYIARKIPFKDLSIKEVAASTLIDKITSMLVLILLGLLFIISLLFIENIIPLVLFLIFILLLIAVTVWGYKNITTGGSALHRFVKYIFRIKYISNFINEIQALKEINKKLLNKILSLSVLLYLIICFQYAFLFISFGLNISVTFGVLIAGVILFVKNYVPLITIGGTGIREIVSVIVFKQLGFNEAVAVNTALAIFIINIAFPALIGVYFTLKGSGK